MKRVLLKMLISVMIPKVSMMVIKLINNSNSVKKNTSTGKRKFAFSFSFRIRSKTYLKPLLA